MDANKIKEAAKSLRKDFDDDVTQGFLVEFGFEKGAKWAVYEFINELWHPADEEPKKNRLVLTDVRSIMDKDHICWATVKLTENGYIRNWSNYTKVTKITRWLYLDDLFSKEGDNYD